MTKNRHMGSTFDEFLEEEGIRAQVESTALKRVLAFEIHQAMRERSLTKVQMANKMGTSRSSLDRLLDPNHSNVTLETIERAAFALGKKVEIHLEDRGRE
jgi:DNA-binding phage protein